MTESDRPASRLPLAIGAAAVFGGVWLILNAQGVGVPPFKRLWPILLILAGVAALVDFFFLSRRPRSAGWALAWIGFGVLAFSLTLHYTSFNKILDWLPSFPTILGLSFLTTWLAAGRKSANLMIAGSVLLVLGVLGFGARFDWLKNILPSAQVVWAILLVAGGGYLVWRTVRQSSG